MKNAIILSSLIFSIGASVQAQDTTYDFVTTVPGYAGTIVLDSPSSTGGGLGDIVSIQITTPLSGSFDVNLATASLVDPTFTWNSSEITEMNVQGFDSFDYNIGAVAADVTGGIYNGVACLNFYLGSSQDTTGSWLAASVPDGGNSVWLLGLALTGLGSLRRFRR